MRYLKSFTIAFSLAIIFVLICFMLFYVSIHFITKENDHYFIEHSKAILVDLKNIIDNSESKDRNLLLSVTMDNLRERSSTTDAKYPIEKIIFLDGNLKPLAHSNVIALANSFRQEYDPETYRIPDAELFHIRTTEYYEFADIYYDSRLKLLNFFQENPSISWLGFFIRFFTPTNWQMDFVSLRKSIHISMPLDQAEQSVFGRRLHLFISNAELGRFIESYLQYYGTRILTIGFLVVFIFGFMISLIRSKNEAIGQQRTWFSRRNSMPPSQQTWNPVFNNSSPTTSYPPQPTPNHHPSINKQKKVQPSGQQYYDQENFALETAQPPTATVQAHPLPYTANYFSPLQPLPPFHSQLYPYSMQPACSPYLQPAHHPFHPPYNYYPYPAYEQQPERASQHDISSTEKQADRVVHKKKSNKQRSKQKKTTTKWHDDNQHLTAVFEAIPLERRPYQLNNNN